MKLNILLTTFFLFFCFKIFGQCAIEIVKDDNGTTYYLAEKEKIYMSDLLGDGILIAFGQLTVIQHHENKELLKFVLSIFVGGNEELVLVPRKITISFKDYSSISLFAETLNKPKYNDVGEIQSCGFRLTLDEYGQLHKKSISSIKIEDTRTDKNFITQPYENIFIEQANCIAKKIVR